MKILLLTVAAILCSSVESVKPRNSYRFSLNSGGEDGEWIIHNSNNTIKTTAIVPGGIYTDLMRNKLIDDILFKDNDVETRWVARDRWIYTRNFTVTNETLNKETINLVFEGLDTIASILLNKIWIGNTDNMFTRHVIDVKKNLKEGQNILVVYFTSPLVVADTRSAEEMVPPQCVPSIYNGECHANQLRKMQASFSWDWGPAFPSMGIWKPVYIDAYDSAIITDVTTRLTFNSSDSTWYLSVKTYLQSSGSDSVLEGHMVTSLDTNNGGKISVYSFLRENLNNKNTLVKEMLIKVNDGQVDTWWPNGYGKQTLYPLEVTFQSTKHPDEYFHKTIKIGFRTIGLIQDSIPSEEEGLTFYFLINGEPIFMKGTNWIPLDILPEAGYDKERVDHLLGSAKSAGMNMMRVWGGGVYESDYFYEKCDEYGILIWQDFMFACSMYPANPNFLTSVATEVEQVVRRLQHHTSIALWAGNNENELALRDNWYGTASNYTHYKSEYIKLYVDTMRPIVTENDPTREYVVSSPSNGRRSEEEGFIADKPGDPRFGDTHYYNYVQNLWSMDTYPKTRFSSEYGFQSIPSEDTLKTATDNSDDLQWNSEFMIHRQHSPSGFSSIMNQIQMHFTLPEPNHPEYFTTLIYLSQINQAMAMKTETEFYRQSRLDWTTMGALYWQLNDVWQAPSWSSIEHSGRWKALQYFAKDFFNDVLISPRLYPTNDIKVYLINDRLSPVINAKMTIDTFKWDSLTPISTDQSDVEIGRLSVKMVESNIVLPARNQRQEIYFRFSLKDQNNQMISPYNYIFPAEFKDIVGFKNPNIELDIKDGFTVADDLYIYTVTIKTDGVVLFLWIEFPYSLGWYSENAFIMTETYKEVTLHTRQPITKKQFKDTVKFKTVFDFKK